MNAPELPMLLIAVAVLGFLFLCTAAVEAIVLALLGWPLKRCFRDALVATAAGFAPGRFELMQLAFTRPVPTIELLAWAAVVLAAECGVYFTLIRMPTGKGEDAALPAEAGTLSVKNVVAVVVASIASHSVLFALVMFVSRFSGR